MQSDQVDSNYGAALFILTEGFWMIVNMQIHATCEPAHSKEVSRSCRLHVKSVVDSKDHGHLAV